MLHVTPCKIATDAGQSVCLCNSNLAWGGGEVWHLNAARSLAARGWRVFLVCRPDGELFVRATRAKELTTVPLPISRLSFLNPFLRRSLIRFFSGHGIKALIMNLPSDLKAAGPAARAAGVRQIIYRRGSALPVRDSLLNRWLYGRVITRLIVNSPATMEQALAANPGLLPKERISILPNGFDAAAFDLALEKARAGTALDKARPFTLGTAGRLNRQKAQHLFLRLGQKVAAAGLDLRLIIAGQGERESELKTLAQDLGLGDRVFFTGFMEDLSPFWNSIDLFVLTSLWEGFGNVIIEAGLARRPVLAFAVSNLPDLVRDGFNGRLFPLPAEERANSPDHAPGPANAEAACAKDGGRPASAEAWPAQDRDRLADMAKAVLELAADPERRRSMGEAGRSMAEGYTQENCMDELERLLRQE